MTDKCTNVAAMKRYWPGKHPDLVCIEHAEDSKRVADVMGFYLVLEPSSFAVGDEIPDEMPICCCSVRSSQKVSIE